MSAGGTVCRETSRDVWHEHNLTRDLRHDVWHEQNSTRDVWDDAWHEYRPVAKAHRLVYRSTLGLKVIKKKKRIPARDVGESLHHDPAARAPPHHAQHTLAPCVSVCVRMCVSECV